MEFMGLGVLDIALVLIVLFGGLIGLITGFLRGGLFVLSWVGAILITLHGFPHVQAMVRPRIETTLLADLVAGGGLFVTALIALHLASHVLSGWIRFSRLNMLDRTLGMVSGMAAAMFVVGAAFLAVSHVPREEFPAFVREARTLPLIENAALVVRRLAPQKLRRQFGPELEERLGGVRRLHDTARSFQTLAQPALPDQPPPETGYSEEERAALDRLVGAAP